MQFLFFIFLLFFASCSDNLLHNESIPHVSIDILNSSDTILAGETIKFTAKINPSLSDVKDYFWTVNSKRESLAAEFSREFKESGLYNVTFYAVDILKDTLSKSLSITVSKAPVCENLNLNFFQGSPIFEWECYNIDSDGELSYNFSLRDENNRILLDTTLSETHVQLGYALPDDYWEVYLTATNSYGFKAELDSIWRVHYE